MRRILSFVVGLMVTLLAIPAVVSAEITVPEFEAGDRWTYGVDLGLSGMDLNGDWTFEVQGKKTISGYDVYDISLEGDGSVTMEIQGIGTATMDFTMDGYNYMRTSDLASVKENISIHMSTSILGIELSIDMYTERLYSPPMNEFGYPLDVGDEWTSASSVTTTSAFVTTTGGNTTSETMTDTESESLSFKCESEESVSVPAGNFQSLKVNQSEDGGGYSYYYISDEVGFYTKSEVYEEDGELEMAMQLKSYSYGAGQDAFSIMDYWWLMILIIIVVVTLAAVASLRSRRSKEEYPPPPPEQF